MWHIHLIEFIREAFSIRFWLRQRSWVQIHVRWEVGAKCQVFLSIYVVPRRAKPGNTYVDSIFSAKNSRRSPSSLPLVASVRRVSEILVRVCVHLVSSAAFAAATRKFHWRSENENKMLVAYDSIGIYSWFIVNEHWKCNRYVGVIAGSILAGIILVSLLLKRTIYVSNICFFLNWVRTWITSCRNNPIINSIRSRQLVSGGSIVDCQ